MKRVLIAILFMGVLAGSTFSWGQDNNAAAPPTAQQAAPAAATAETPPAATVPAGTPTPAAQQQPAAQPGQLPSWMEYKPAYTGEENDITNPHRTTEEITTWTQQAAADVLTFSSDDYKGKITGFKRYFVTQGWEQYVAYLKDTKAIDKVSVDGYSIGAIVDEAPQIINQGSSNGAYHWILRMPITISFFKKDPASGETKTGPSGKFYLFMDVLRVAQGGGDDGIAITNWRVMDVPKN